VRSKTTIPIPRVIDWSDDSDNPVGHEYMLMEHCQGVKLSEIWMDLTSSAQIRCIESVTRCLQQMASLDFPAYGSLYFADVPSLAGVAQTRVDERFSVGPSCDAQYWDCNVDETRYYDIVQPNRGPCKLSECVLIS